MTVPTPVTPVDAEGAAITDHFEGTPAPMPAGFAAQLAATGATVLDDDASRADAARDWWPIAIGWAAEGAVPMRPAAVVRPATTAQVASVLTLCNDARVPVTPIAGRSGVCGGSIPVHGGVALDLTGLEGVVVLDETSLTVDVRAGTFGPDFEAALGGVGSGYTMGH